MSIKYVLLMTLCYEMFLKNRMRHANENVREKPIKNIIQRLRFNIKMTDIIISVIFFHWFNSSSKIVSHDMTFLKESYNV